MQMERRTGASPLTISASVSGRKGKTLPIIRSRILRAANGLGVPDASHLPSGRRRAALSHSSATHQSPVGRRRRHDTRMDQDGWIRRANSRYQLVEDAPVHLLSHRREELCLRTVGAALALEHLQTRVMHVGR